MTQKRVELNRIGRCDHGFTRLALPHCHHQRVENIDIDNLCKKFALKTNKHRSTFGYMYIF
jgi:hypothetical protein